MCIFVNSDFDISLISEMMMSHHQSLINFVPHLHFMKQAGYEHGSHVKIYLFQVMRCSQTHTKLNWSTK